MKKANIPASISTLNRGKVTLYIKNEYENKLTKQDINSFFNLFRNFDESDVIYHGRSPCKKLSIKSLNGGNLVVREYWHGGLFGKILRNLFWQSLRPLRELLICETASKKGIRTTEVIAIVKNKIMGPLYKCKLVSREITNAIDLMELLLNYDENHLFAQKKQIIDKVAKAVREVHDAGIYHADLHLKNILIQPTDSGTFNVYIIDLDKSRQYREMGINRRMKNIRRLDRSLEKFLINFPDRRILRMSYSSPTSQNTFGLPRQNDPTLPAREGFVGLVTKKDKIRFLREYVKSNDELKGFLIYYLHTYSTHKLHRLWWLMTGSVH